MKLTGAQALIKSLENEGVELVFGIPGGVVLPIYDALYSGTPIRHILMRHEQCAAHAADGYARATGKVGVCMATSGPGATNLITGIANAQMDSVPIVAITGQVATHVMGTDAFQEANSTGITLPIVKHSYLVLDPEDIPQVIKEAFHIASTGRPGPVHIDIPVDISKGEVNFFYPSKVDLPGYRPTYRGHPKQIKQAAEAIHQAERPVLYTGGGIVASGAWEELQALAEHANIPVTVTLMGKGIFPEKHPLSLGMPGMHGTRYANYSLMDCDLIIAVGVRFDDRVTGKLSAFAPKARVIHVDIDPAEISKNIPAQIPVVGDAKQVLAGFLEAYKKIEGPGADRGGWLARIEEWKRKFPLHYRTERPLPPEFVVESISRLAESLDRQTIVTTGVGQNQMWAAQYYQAVTPRGFISSGGLGTMGFGLPAAIGAQFGRPEANVVVIDGDGSFQMVSQDLATIAVNQLPITIAVMNNGFLGMVRQWQELFYDRRYAASCLGSRGRPASPAACAACSARPSTCGSPDFVKLAEAYGIKGLRITDKSEVEPALSEAFRLREPVLIDFVVTQEENVFPMVAPGASIDEMLGGIPGDSIDHMIDEEDQEPAGLPAGMEDTG